MSVRPDFAVIASLVEPGSTVLDVGCGDGALLAHLARTRNVDGRGLELSQAGVNACVARGLSVIQGDADRDLAGYPSGAFDYVILSRTIQAVRNPTRVLEELRRVGRRAVVSIPNFGHWRARLTLLASGRMPASPAQGHPWHACEAVHPCTVRDFAALSRSLDLKIERAVPISQGEAGPPFASVLWRANWFAEDVVFLLAPAREPAPAVQPAAAHAA